jgi:hypothetical protein
VRSERQTQRALAAEGLVTTLTNSAMRLSACLQAELNRSEWQQKTGREGLEAAFKLLRSHMGPLIDGVNCQRYREVLRCAKALADTRQK